MPVLPHSQILFGPSVSVTISGPHIQVINSRTGNVLHTTIGHEGVLKSGPIRCASVDTSIKYLVTSGEDKQLKVWEIDGLKLLSERELPKRPTGIRFTADGHTILVSDKFGDVFSYPFKFTPLTVKQKKDALSSHENPSGGQLVLGHASLLNAFLLSNDEKFIITADRDEHIRVSWYPQGYNIEMYCLGHTKFISAIHNPQFAPSDLISGGGDPVLKIWDWMTGTVKHNIDIWDTVEPYITVRSTKRMKGDEGGGRRRGKGKKSKGKGKAHSKTELQNEDDSTNPDEGGLVVSPDAVNSEAPQTDVGEKVLVIHKIETVSSESGHHIVFNAVGATALFVCQYPGGSISIDVQYFDLGQLVIDFTVTGDNLIWVCLDRNNGDDMVRVLRLSDGKLSDAPLESPLLLSLNKQCVIPATVDEIKKLDIYGDLTTMPKNSEGEQDQGSDAPILDEDTPNEKQVSKKVLGRLKSKKAVLAKLASGGEDMKVGGEGLEEPDSKKSRSEHGGSVSNSERDVLIAEV